MKISSISNPKQFRLLLSLVGGRFEFAEPILEFVLIFQETVKPCSFFYCLQV